MKKHIGNIVKSLISLSVGALIIYIFFGKFTAEDIARIKASMVGANYLWVVLSVTCATLAMVSRSMRWKMLLETMGYQLSFSNSFFAVSFNYVVNLAIPRAGELARCAAIYRTEKIPVERSIGTLINERIIDLVMLVIVGVLVFLLQYDMFFTFFQERVLDVIMAFEFPKQLIAFGILAILIGCVALFFIYQRKKTWLMEKLVGLKEGMLSILELQNPVQFIAHSLFIWIMYWAMIYTCFLSVVDPATLSPYSGLMVLFFGTFGFIAVQGGLGIYPVIVSWVLMMYGVTEEASVAAGWILWISQTLMVLIAGLMATWFIIRRTKTTEVK